MFVAALPKHLLEIFRNNTGLQLVIVIGIEQAPDADLVAFDRYFPRVSDIVGDGKAFAAEA